MVSRTSPFPRLFNPGDTVRYTGRHYPHLRNLPVVVEGITEVGFLRVSYPGRDGRITRLNPRCCELVRKGRQET